MSYSPGKYNRYITVEVPTDVNTKGSLSRPYATSFSTWAMKKANTGNSVDDLGKRTTISESTWYIPFNTVPKDARFYEANATTDYYYIKNVEDVGFQTELEIKAELRV